MYVCISVCVCKYVISVIILSKEGNVLFYDALNTFFKWFYDVGLLYCDIMSYAQCTHVGQLQIFFLSYQ